MPVPVLQAEQRWECPDCHQQKRTHETGRVITPLHACKRHNGFAVPFVRVYGSELNRSKVRIKLVDRGDFVNGEIVRTDAYGRPVMAVHTERADGSHDTHVYAAAARADVHTQ
jgi:hypothetical protein